MTQAVTSTPTATKEEYTITAAPMADAFTFTVADLPTPEAYLFVQRSEDLIQLTTEVRKTKGVELQAEGLSRKYLYSQDVNLNDSTGFLLRLSNKSLCFG